MTINRTCLLNTSWKIDCHSWRKSRRWKKRCTLSIIIIILFMYIDLRFYIHWIVGRWPFLPTNEFRIFPPSKIIFWPAKIILIILVGGEIKKGKLLHTGGPKWPVSHRGPTKEKTVTHRPGVPKWPFICLDCRWKDKTVRLRRKSLSCENSDWWNQLENIKSICDRIYKILYNIE